MASVKIYGHVLSGNTKRVAVICNELGLKYELVPIDLPKGAHKEPEYLANMQPFGAIPVFEDTDGTRIYESRAITRYLIVRYGKDSGLLPPVTDTKAYGLFEQAASIEYSAFDPSASGLTRECLIKPMFGDKPNEALVAHYRTTLKTKLEGYERVLAKQKYLAGDKITLADLLHLPYGSTLNKVDPTFIGAQPNVKRWWDDISSRESWKEFK